MKILFLLLLIQSAWSGPIDTLACSSHVKKLASEWKASGEWVKQFQGGLDKFFHASPTDQVGEWVLTRQTPKGSVISKVGQSGRIETSFEGKECKKVTKAYPHSAPKKDHVDDKELRSFISSQKKGVIYVWSPRMGLSQKGIAEIQRAASALKLPLLILLDKEIPEVEFQKLKKTMGNTLTKRVDSLEFRMRNVEQHFPAILVFNDSKILPEVKYGFEKSAGYQSDLSRMLGQSK
jgi:hypothetical protein